MTRDHKDMPYDTEETLRHPTLFYYTILMFKSNIASYYKTEGGMHKQDGTKITGRLCGFVRKTTGREKEM